MAVRLEIGWRPDLIDAEGEALRRKAQEYFGLTLDRVQVLRLLMLDMELAPSELEAVRTEVFTNPVTQVSSYAPLAREFDWALWVGFRPGVRDNAGAMAREAIEAFLGRPLPPEAAVYTSKLYLLSRPDLNEDQAARLARGLLANDLIQEFRLFSRQKWDPAQGVGLILPRVQLAHQPQVTVFPLDSLETLRRLSAERHLALRDQDLPIILGYFQRAEVLARREKIGLGPPTPTWNWSIWPRRAATTAITTLSGAAFITGTWSPGSIFSWTTPSRCASKLLLRKSPAESPGWSRCWRTTPAWGSLMTTPVLS